MQNLFFYPEFSVHKEGLRMQVPSLLLTIERAFGAVIGVHCYQEVGMIFRLFVIETCHIIVFARLGILGMLVIRREKSQLASSRANEVISTCRLL